MKLLDFAKLSPSFATSFAWRKCPGTFARHTALRLQYAARFTPYTNTMRSSFAQQDHMQVFKICLGLSRLLETLTLFLLLYAIRLVGWLKHCNLSLSVSL